MYSTLDIDISLALAIMSESELAVIKPEALKSYIWLQCFDGSIQQVEEEVAMFCPMICREIVKNGTGSSKNHAITLPERVNPASLSLILDYCRFHQVPGRSNKVCCHLCFACKYPFGLFMVPFFYSFPSSVCSSNAHIVSINHNIFLFCVIAF